MGSRNCAQIYRTQNTASKNNDQQLALDPEQLDHVSAEKRVPYVQQKIIPHYLNTKQAASYLNLSHQYLEIARHKGGGPQYIKLAKAVRYRPEDLDDWMVNHTQRNTAEYILRTGGKS